MKSMQAYEIYKHAGKVLLECLEKEFPEGSTVNVQLNCRQVNLSRMRVIGHYRDGSVTCEMYTPDRWRTGQMKRFVKHVFFENIKG